MIGEYSGNGWLVAWPISTENQIEMPKVHYFKSTLYLVNALDGWFHFQIEFENVQVYAKTFIPGFYKKSWLNQFHAITKIIDWLMDDELYVVPQKAFCTKNFDELLLKSHNENDR